VFKLEGPDLEGPTPVLPIPQTLPCAQVQLRLSLPKTQRAAYGEGIEAQRTAKYRLYPYQESHIFRFLQHFHGQVSMACLRNLIDNVLDSWPEPMRPSGPNRSQKRTKGSLVYWLDEHAAVVGPFLPAHRAVITDQSI
jgi:hypothetical protein